MKDMKILVDMTHIYMGTIHASTSIYVFRILDSINVDQRGNFTLLILSELEDYVKINYPDYKYIVFKYDTDTIIKYKKGFSRIIFQFKKFRQIVEESQCGGLLIVSDQFLYTSAFTKLKKISVIHDLKGIKDQSLFKSLKYYFHYALLMLSSSKVIAISNYTKKDLNRYYLYLFSKKIEVVYNSISLNEDTVCPLGFPKDTKYILYVNTLQKYKGVATLLQAYKLAGNLDYKIVIVGKPTDYWNDEMVPYIKENNLEDKIIRLQNVSDEELNYLYKNASLFVSSSTREGFGYTPIEAAIFQCPVVCSTCESLPEVTMGKLEYYAPVNDPAALSKKMLKMLNKPPRETYLKEVSTLFRQKYLPREQAKNIYNIFISQK